MKIHATRLYLIYNHTYFFNSAELIDEKEWNSSNGSSRGKLLQLSVSFKSRNSHLRFAKELVGPKKLEFLIIVKRDVLKLSLSVYS